MKASLVKEYNTKDLGDVKTIIEWQIFRDLMASIMKIDQLVFIWDLVIKKKLMNCNVNIIPIKVGSYIEIIDLENYEEANF